jgi:TIR domain
MSGSDIVSCFLSHKCNRAAHAFAESLAEALGSRQVTLLVDPFETGHDVVTRIHTVEFHSLVLLLCPESWTSPACQEELDTARARSVPILTARLAGEVPDALKGRLYSDVGGLAGPALENALAKMATAIDVRARLYKTIGTLDPQNHPEETRQAAQFLGDEADRTLLAESLEHIASYYTSESDYTTRYWLALAVGRAGTCEAKRILRRFSWEKHPLPLEGIRLARQMLKGLRC